MLLAVLLSLASPAHAVADVHIRARAFQPGEVLLISVTGQPRGAPSGRFDETPVDFFPSGPGTYLAFFGLDLDISTGTHRLELQLKGKDKKPQFWGSDVVIEGKAFPKVSLKVKQNFVTPKKADETRAEKEAKLMEGLFQHRGPERLFDKRFASPIAGASSARFGERRVFNGTPKAPHSGADLKAKKGTPVLAPAGGKVVLVAHLFYPGNVVVLDHGWRLFTYYAHLSEFAVKKGQVVKKGDLLGKVGATGRVTGPHLHWAARLHNARINPFSLTSSELDEWLKSR